MVSYHTKNNGRHAEWNSPLCQGLHLPNPHPDRICWESGSWDGVKHVVQTVKNTVGHWLNIIRIITKFPPNSWRPLATGWPVWNEHFLVIAVFSRKDDQRNQCSPQHRRFCWWDSYHEWHDYSHGNWMNYRLLPALAFFLEPGGECFGERSLGKK